jgi:hypothetical protein
MLLSAVARASIVLTAASNTLSAPFRALIVWDRLRVVGDGWRLSVLADTRPVESGRITCVGSGCSRIGLLEAEKRAGGGLVMAP